MGIAVQISVHGEYEVKNNIDSFIEKLYTKIGRAIDGAAIRCEAGAKKNCPVDTGRLRSSIHEYDTDGMKHTDLSANGHMIYSRKVGTGVNYAWYVELGTYKMSAQPFLMPGFLIAVAKLQQQYSKMDEYSVSSSFD